MKPNLFIYFYSFLLNIWHICLTWDYKMLLLYKLFLKGAVEVIFSHLDDTLNKSASLPVSTVRRDICCWAKLYSFIHFSRSFLSHSLVIMILLTANHFFAISRASIKTSTVFLNVLRLCFSAFLMLFCSVVVPEIGSWSCLGIEGIFTQSWLGPGLDRLDLIDSWLTCCSPQLRVS